MTAHILAAVIAALTAAGCIRFTVFSHDRLKRMRHRTRFYLHPGPGFASHREITLHLGRMAAIWHGRRCRRDLPGWARLILPARHYAVRQGRGPGFRRIFTHGEDQVAVIAPPRIGKTGYLADRVYGHPGACVALTTRHDIWEHTSGKRAALGPVQVFNPENVGNVRSTFRVDIVADCIDPVAAQRTAAALTGPVDAGTDNAMWQGLAMAALAGLLHAAAVLGEDMSAVWRWANRIDEHQVREAMGRPGASPDRIASALAIQRDSKTADSIRVILGDSLAWVASPHLRGMVSGPGLAGFDAAGWIESCGTIYFISSGADSSAEPLFRAVIEKIYRECRLAGSRTPYGRIPNPVLFALDEVTQTAAVPLGQWLATAAGDGIQICFVCHTPAQLRARYGRDEADAIWQLAAVKVILGGNSDPDLAEGLAKVTGYTSGDHPEPKIPADYLRQLPGLRAVVIAKERSAVTVKIRPIWKRPSHRLLVRPLAWRLGLLYGPYVPLWEFLAPVAELSADTPEPGEEAA